VLSKSRIFKFLKRDCGTIPVAEITSGIIIIIIILLTSSLSGVGQKRIGRPPHHLRQQIPASALGGILQNLAAPEGQRRRQHENNFRHHRARSRRPNEKFPKASSL
jgi:hypothetical protein